MKRIDTVKLARYLIQRAYQKQVFLTITKLQKLMYALEGGLLANDIDVFSEQCVAWRYGPVYLKVFTRIYPEQLNIKNKKDLCFITLQTHKNNKIIKDMVDKVLDVFGKYSTGQLSSWSRIKNGPWSKTPHLASVSRELIRDYFRQK